MSIMKKTTSITREILVKIQREPLLIIECSTLLMLLGVVFWSVGPLLEEWGVLWFFRQRGVIGGFANLPSLFIFRPLHLSPYLLGYVLFGSNPISINFSVGILFLCRYLAARWAVFPIFNGYAGWLIGILAAVLIPWNGIWLGRFLPAQLSAVCFFMVFGLYVRLFNKWSWIYAGFSVFILVFLMMTYQALSLCLTMVPFVIWFLYVVDNGSFQVDFRLFKLMQIFLVMLAGLIVYGIYCLLISKVSVGVGYETSILQDEPISVYLRLKALLKTAYFTNNYLLPMMLSIISILSIYCFDNRAYSFKYGLVLVVVIGLMLLFLPTFSLIYITRLHMNDIERVLLPVAVGFVLLCVMLLKFFVSGCRLSLIRLISISVVGVVFLFAVLSSISIRDYSKLQMDVVKQVSNIIKDKSYESIVIRDFTGVLGDVYTFYQETLGVALSLYEDHNIIATVCTDVSVDRIHPVVRRYPLEATKHCNEFLEKNQGILFLSAKVFSGKMIIAKE